MDIFASEKCPVAIFCEHCNELLGFIKAPELFHQLSNCHLPKKDPAAWSSFVSCRSDLENSRNCRTGILMARNEKVTKFGWPLVIRLSY